MDDGSPEREERKGPLERFLHMIRHPYEAAMRVGNFDRVRKPGEQDPDEERLHDLNKTWREMLRGDPWMVKLMTHVRLLLLSGFIFFSAFFMLGFIVPARHPVFSWVTAFALATIPYWLWVGNWYHKIERKVFESFKKRFGKHFHLK